MTSPQTTSVSKQAKRPSNWLVPVAFLTLIALYSFGALASLMRMRFGDAGPIGLGYQRVMLPGILLLGLMLIQAFRVQRFNISATLLIIMFLYAALLGIRSNGLSSYYISHMFQAIFGIVLYIFGRQLIWQRPDLMKIWIRILAKVTTIAYVPIMIIYTYWTMTQDIYLGMSGSILMLSAMVFLYDKNYRWLSLCIILIVLTGKRGELIGLLIAFLVHIYIKGRQNGIGQMAKQIFLFLAIGAFVLALLSLVAGSFLAEILTKFSTIFITDFSNLSDPEVRKAIGGRGVEILIFYQTFVEPGLMRLLTGLGYGWNVPVNVPGYEETDVLHFVHISPLNTVGQYGLILAVLYWGMILGTIARATKWAKAYPEYLILAPYAAGMVFVSLTAYAIAVEPGFWIALGAISLHAHRPRENAPVQLLSASSQ